jgi:hypothetical protein
MGHMGHGHIVHKWSEDRVIYGSDMPFGHPSFEIKKVEVAGLTKKQLNLVLEKIHEEYSTYNGPKGNGCKCLLRKLFKAVLQNLKAKTTFG